jgi:hypothetical protein
MIINKESVYLETVPRGRRNEEYNLLKIFIFNHIMSPAGARYLVCLLTSLVSPTFCYLRMTNQLFSIPCKNCLSKLSN